MSDQPDGRNINLGCGSLHLENLQRAVLQEKADLGVAFDGDADRALFVTGTGRVVDGDGVLLAASRYMKRHGTLRGDAVVGTVMSNLGLELALAREGLKLLRTPVGDKYVLDEMLRSGSNLGGEQSGHVIFRDLATTGDGLLTALQILRIMADERRTLEELVEGLEVFPQTIRNVRVREKVPLESLPQVMDADPGERETLGQLRTDRGALQRDRTSGPRHGRGGNATRRWSGTPPRSSAPSSTASVQDDRYCVRFFARARYPGNGSNSSRRCRLPGWPGCRQ